MQLSIGVRCKHCGLSVKKHFDWYDKKAQESTLAKLQTKKALVASISNEPDCELTRRMRIVDEIHSS